MQIGVSFVYAELKTSDENITEISYFQTRRKTKTPPESINEVNSIMCFMVVMEDEHNNSDVCQRMCSFKVSLQIKEGTVLMTRECLIRRNIFF